MTRQLPWAALVEPVRARKILATALDAYHPDTEWSLLADMYGFTMPQAWIENGWAAKRGVFYASFRKLPPNVGYAVFGGTTHLADWIRRVRYTDTMLAWMASLQTDAGERLFSDKFLKRLHGKRLSLKLTAVPEGELVFPHEPLIRGEGPIWELAFIEGALLNFINQFTPVMTKAARMVDAADGEPIADNCLRRGLGIGGSIEAALAAYMGGVSKTSNMLAAYYFDIPPTGTMAHCFVVSFAKELRAFLAFAKANPGNTVFLVDTFNTILGVKNAIRAAKALKKIGRKLHAIRLDSGDLAALSIKARELLDAAGFTDTKIIGTNSLDEFKIASIKAQGGKICVWAAGDAFADADLFGAIWKMCAIEEKGEWRLVLKLSEQSVKTSIPGFVAVRRWYDRNGLPVGDTIFDELMEDGTTQKIIDPRDANRIMTLVGAVNSRLLLAPLIDNGGLAAPLALPANVRKLVRANVLAMDAAVKRHDNPHSFPVGMTPGLDDARRYLIRKFSGL